MKALGSALAIVLLCAACHGPEVDVSLRPIPGEKRVFETSSEFAMVMNGEKMGPGGGGGQRNKLTYEIKDVDEEGFALVKVTADAAALMGGGQGMMAAGMMGGDALSSTPVELQMQLGSDGTVYNVSGMDSVAGQVAEAMSAQFSEQMKGMPGGGQTGALTGVFKDMLSDEQAEKSLQMLTDFYPDGPVKVGAKWTKTASEDEMGMKMDTTTTYKLVSCEDGIATIDVSGKVELDKASLKESMGGMMPAGMDMDFDMSGKQSGTILMDSATGWPTDINASLEITTSMEFEGKSMESGMEMGFHVQSREGQ